MASPQETRERVKRAVMADKISEKLPAEALRMDADAPKVDLEEANREHECYYQVLKKIGVEVLKAEVSNEHADSVFVEDPVVAVGGKIIVLCNMSQLSRAPEVQKISPFFQKEGYSTKEMPEGAHLDGGDVLQMGGGADIFVGLSSRSNQKAVDFLQETFPERRIHGIPVTAGLHLKSFLSEGFDNEIIIGSSHAAQKAKQFMEPICKERGYTFFQVEDDYAANVVLINDSMIIRAQKEFPKSIGVLLEHYTKEGREIYQCTNTELGKVDGALTCCSVLLLDPK
mmetsp:Transcript_38754/g.54023  ORF Transcript_38754/g.54023 Transcript_38754/m.54023 type:complete len:284 (-) Transcript_38754:46-897(-)